MLVAATSVATAGEAQRKSLPVQLGVRISPDTVTVGQQFIAVIRVRAPRSATVELPQESDSASRASPTATAIIGKPVIQQATDSLWTTVSAAYKLAAWDVGTQPLGLGDIVVSAGADTGYVSLARRTVFVRSVLPEDTALRVPKPPRSAITLAPFDWRPILLAALAVIAGLIAWRIWVWWRRRALAPVDPFTEAQREFARIEALGLIAKGEPETHAALMSDAVRNYLARRVDGIRRSHTSAELLSNAGAIRHAAAGLGELLGQADLVKFARSRIGTAEAERLGLAAREIVRSVEEALVKREEERRKAA
jgi:hypothetical protein